MTQLLLMRHAKSDWNAEYEGDHERPLNQRGVRSAKLMGRVLAHDALSPDLVLSSTAVRARTTAQLAAEAGSWDTSIELDSGLYHLGPDGVLAIAANAAPADRLMLVGHQPTWSLLVRMLTGAMVDMKTASVAVIDLEIRSWSDLAEGVGSLTAIHHPRTYFGTVWDSG